MPSGLMPRAQLTSSSILRERTVVDVARGFRPFGEGELDSKWFLFVGDSPSAWCERAAALLAAGLPPRRVTELIGEPPMTIADGGAIRVAWQLCDTAGASAAGLMSSLAEAARDWDRIAADRATALAGPRASARLLCVLPFAVFGIGLLLDLNSADMLFGTVLGWCCVVAGSAAAGAGWWWIAHLLNAAAQTEPAPGFACDLCAQLLTSGLPLARAMNLVSSAWPHGVDQTEAALSLAHQVGMPPVRALRSEAAAQRLAAATQARRRAAELGVRLTLPLGLCMLPAFLLWGVVPLMFAVMSHVAPHLVVPSIPNSGEQ